MKSSSLSVIFMDNHDEVTWMMTMMTITRKIISFAKIFLK